MRIKCFLLIIILVIIKLPLLFIHHIQEDAFITWRVAQNFLEYGVIGFNGPEKISASTTHFYVFISIIFNFIFGKENFIYPILIFNTLLFTSGTVIIARIFFNDFNKIIFFTILIGLLPPSLKIGYLGMEYAIIFFLDAIILYFGFYLRQNWAFIIIPILLLWTRLDTAIFLGILFLFDWYYTKKWNFLFVFGGIVGLLTVLMFNFWYFHEFINQTITAKKYSYELNLSIEAQLEYALDRLDHFWGIIKIPEEHLNFITYVILFFEFLFLIYALFKYSGIKKIILIFFFTFAHIKMSLFIYKLSFFDWYYWIPQILAFSIILIIILDTKKYKKNILIYLIFGIPAFLYQISHSLATANGEWNYRRGIGLYLNKIEKDKTQKIFLEPAGYIPYFSGLKAIDQVGLVDKKHLNQIIKNHACSDFNTFAEQKPKYILSQDIKLENKINLSHSCENFKEIYNYKLIKVFKIKEHLNTSSVFLEFMYTLKPSGRDYYLYERIKN